MIDMYTIGLCAMIVMFALMLWLAIMLIRDQSTLSARQRALEDRTALELESFRAQVKEMKRRAEEESAEA